MGKLAWSLAVLLVIVSVAELVYFQSEIGRLEKYNSQLKELSTSINNSQKIKICPTAWIDNSGMLGDNLSASREYFSVGGKRFELDQIDADWVKSNCNMNKSRIIY